MPNVWHACTYYAVPSDTNQLKVERLTQTTLMGPEQLKFLNLWNDLEIFFELDNVSLFEFQSIWINDCNLAI
jgi:hypothetical protein